MAKEVQLIEQSFVTLDYRTVKPLQGNRKVLLPEAEKRLLKSLSDKGRFVPEYVWLNPADGQYYTLDGHSRLKVYEKHDLTFDGGYALPFLLVTAADAKDAAEKLQIIDSDYGTVTREGQQQFADMFQLDVKWLNETTLLTEFPDFNFIDDFRTMQTHLQRDLIATPPIQPSTYIPPQNQTTAEGTETPQAPPQYQTPPPPPPAPLATDDHYSNITEVLKYAYKLEYNDVINMVMEKENIQRREEAFIFIIREFKKCYICD